MKNIIVGLIAILLGTIVLKIFFPWWLIAIVMGLVAAFAVYNWVTKATGLSPAWAKRIVTIAIVIFLISLTISLIDQKWPWLGATMESRQIYSSFQTTDRVDPKYPNTLAMSIYQTEKMRVENEELKYKKALEAIQEKLAAGKELSQNDKDWIEKAKEKLPKLDKELDKIRLSRANGISWSTELFKSIQANSEAVNTIWFGLAILLTGILLSKFTGSKKGGKMLAWLGGLLIIIAVGTLIYSQAPPPPPSGQRTAAAAKMTRATPEPPREPYSITVALKADHWSDPVFLPDHAKFYFHGPKAEFIREADKFPGDTYTRYPDDPRFQSGLRFKGPEGQRLIIKVVPET